MKKPIQFGKYYLLDRINVGGMAEVYKAKSFGLEGAERMVAVKRILPTIAEDKELISMFIDEAKIAVQLNHPNICQVFDWGKVDDTYYIAMEYVSGRDLRTVYQRCKSQLIDGAAILPLAQSCFVVMKLCEGLDYAHNKKDTLGNELRLVHRDVSPQNVIISYEGEVKLIDFGIAKVSGSDAQTAAGVLKGKFAYMSPEQVRGERLDRRSDIFAAGIVLYELLTGERLFHGDNEMQSLEKVRNVEILPPTSYNRKLPEELERIVMKALERDVEERYQTAIDLHDDLQAFMYTSGEFYSRRELSAWMKRVFRTEMETEQAELEAAREFKPSAPPVAAPNEPLARARATMSMAVLRIPSEPTGEMQTPSSWTPKGSKKQASTPPPPPRSAVQSIGEAAASLARTGGLSPEQPPARLPRTQPPARSAAPASSEPSDQDPQEKTDVDGLVAAGKIAEPSWEGDNLETHAFEPQDREETLNTAVKPPPEAEADLRAAKPPARSAMSARDAGDLETRDFQREDYKDLGLPAPAAPPLAAAARGQPAAQARSRPPTSAPPAVAPPAATPPGARRPLVTPLPLPPRVEPPRVEPPRIELLRVEPPRVEPPKPEPPRVEPPKPEPPKPEPPQEEEPTDEPESSPLADLLREPKPAQPATATPRWTGPPPPELELPAPRPAKGQPKSRAPLWALLSLVAVVLGGFGAYWFLLRSAEVIVIAEPSRDLTILIDQKQVAVSESPARVRLDAGPHEIEIRHAGYSPFRKPLTLHAGEILVQNVRLESAAPPTGGFTLFSEPAGASATLDGTTPLGGATPMRVQSVLAGPHTLEVRLGKRLWRQQILIEAGKTIAVRATLPPEPVEASNPSEPEPPPSTQSAEKTGPSETADKAGKTAGGLGKGAREKKERGHARREREREQGKLAENGHTKERVLAGGTDGYLRINSKPWTKIIVDGVDTGLNTPQTSYRMPAGTHKITLYNPNFAIRETFTVTVHAGEIQTIIKDFQH